MSENFSYRLISYSDPEFCQYYDTIQRGSYQKCLDAILCLYCSHRDRGLEVNITRTDGDNIVAFTSRTDTAIHFFEVGSFA